MNNKRLSIYVTGPRGMVGWLAGWSYTQDSIKNVSGITLSLDHEKAITFFNNVDDDVKNAKSIADFIRNRSEVYGVAHCFAW
jgi:hypothetical protein